MCGISPDMKTGEEKSLEELEAESERIQALAAKLLEEIERILDEIRHRDDRSDPPPVVQAEGDPPSDR